MVCGYWIVPGVREGAGSGVCAARPAALSAAPSKAALPRQRQARVFFGGGSLSLIRLNLASHTPNDNGGRATGGHPRGIPCSGMRSQRVASAIMSSAVLLGGCTDSSTASSALPGIWSILAPMPTPRGFLAAAELGGKVYAIGGDIPGPVDVPVPTDALEIFDPSVNSWSAGPPMRVALTAVGAGVVNGMLYAVGGYDAGHAAVNTLQAYDPTTATWTLKSPMPTARRYPAVAVMVGKLYVIGGGAPGGTCCAMYATVEAYDPATD